MCNRFLKKAISGFMVVVTTAASVPMVSHASDYEKVTCPNCWTTFLKEKAGKASEKSKSLIGQAVEYTKENPIKVVATILLAICALVENGAAGKCAGRGIHKGFENIHDNVKAFKDEVKGIKFEEDQANTVTT